MRKVYLFAGMAAMLLASCSSNDRLDASPNEALAPNAGSEMPVGFDAYTQRGTTRAGAAGVITSLGAVPSDDEAAKKAGFGVFAYYTDNNDYDPQSLPNFMYNQQVYAKTAENTFVYEPVKYWPNEYGSNAISDDNDKVSFFAYAPYVEVVPSTGKLSASADEAKWGITGMSRNSASGDPLIKYIVSFDQDKMVDLMWGVCDNPEWGVIQGNIQNINEGVKGLPWLDVQRPKGVDQKMMFTFKHALSQLNVQIDYDKDVVEHTTDAGNALADATKIYVRSITFTGFATKGALNLNNTETGAGKAYWLDYNGTTDLESGEEVTIHDGRKDGKEGASGATASNEKTLGLNPDLIQTTLWGDANQESGVTNTLVNLFRKWDSTNSKYVAMAADDPVFVIPTGEEVTVTIVYDVETVDGNLATYVSDAKTTGSSIENRITKTVNFGSSNMESGKKYTLKLHLGMNSVKFDAAVSPWDDTTTSTEEWLPSNKPQFVASASAIVQSVNVEASATSFAYTMTGLNGGESVNSTLGSETGSNIATAPADASANASGAADLSVTLTANNTVNNITNNKVITSEGQSSHKKVILNVVQLAKALGMAAPASPTAGTTITPTYTADVTWASDLKSITVLKNGKKLTKVDASPTDGQFSFADGTITLGTPSVAGEKYTITIQAGDAAEETITVTIG